MYTYMKINTKTNKKEKFKKKKNPQYLPMTPGIEDRIPRLVVVVVKRSQRSL